MALLFADGYDTYGYGSFSNSDIKARLLSNYDSLTGLNVFPSSNYSRSGGGSLFIGTSYDQPHCRKIIGLNDELMIGFAVLIPQAVQEESVGFALRNNLAELMCRVCIGVDNSICVFDKNGDECGRSYPRISAGVFHHIECRVKYHPTAGELEVRIDGETVSEINTNTIVMGSNQFFSFEFGAFITSFADKDAYFDDLVIYDDQTFKGPIIVGSYSPNGNGPESDWTIFGASSTYEAIDETITDDDTSYIQGNVASDKSSVTFPDAPLNIIGIYGVYSIARMKTSEPGEGKVRINCISNTTLEQGIEHNILSGYRYFGQGFEKDPNTGAAWLVASYNSIIIEFEKTA